MRFCCVPETTGPPAEGITSTYCETAEAPETGGGFAATASGPTTPAIDVVRAATASRRMIVEFELCTRYDGSSGYRAHHASASLLR